MLALTIVMSIVLSIAKWRRSPDDFTPQVLPELQSTAKGTR